MTRVKNTCTFAATGTTFTWKLQENGVIDMAIIVTPNFTNAVTTVVTITDTDGYTIWTSDAFPENSTSVRPGINIPSDYNYTVTVTLSGVAGVGGGDVIVVFFVQQI